MADDKLIELERRLSAIEVGGADLSRRVSSELSPKIAALEARAGTAEAGLAALQNPAPPRPSLLERLNALADWIGKVLIPIAVVVVTWQVKDSVESALKERELEVTAGKAMQEALTKLRANALTSEEADAAALVLASMGKPSIMFLISEYKSGTAEATVAVDKALFVLGLTHQTDLCDCLHMVIGDKGKRFRIETYRLAATHIGQAQCQKSAKELRDLKYILRDPSRYAGRFSVNPTPQQIEDLRKEVDNALNRLSL